MKPCNFCGAQIFNVLKGKEIIALEVRGATGDYNFIEHNCNWADAFDKQKSVQFPAEPKI